MKLAARHQLRMEEDNIYNFKMKKEQNQFANIVNDNMISSVLESSRLYDGWSALVLRDHMIIQRYSQEQKELEFYYSHPIYFCSRIIDYLQLHDEENFLKINPFDGYLDFYDVDYEPMLTPYQYLMIGKMYVVD